MKFLSLYRLSFYVMLFFATAALCVDSTEGYVPVLLPPAVAVAGVAAYLTVDRHPRLGLSRGAANLLAAASVGLVFLEYAVDDKLLDALAHWLTYLQVVKMFLPKTAEDDWFLFLLGLMQVLVGAVISQSDRVGIMLFAWAVLALWVLALFSLHRDAARDRAARSAPESATEEPYPGLLDWPFLLSATRVTALTMALGGVIFLAMPRRSSVARIQGLDPLPAHMTGFDDEVQLGQLGEILENDTVVMSVEMYDGNDRRAAPVGEPLWRGVTMAKYDRGRWHRVERRRASLPIPDDSRGTIRQNIKLEANDSYVLFGLRPMRAVEAASPRSEPEPFSDGTIARPSVRPGAYDYRVISEADPNRPQPGEMPLKSEDRAAFPGDSRTPCGRGFGRSPSGSSRGSRPRRRRRGPGPWNRTSAIRASSATPSGWTSRTPTSTPSRTSSSTARRGIASISPAPWRCCCGRSRSPRGWSTASRGATGTRWPRC